MYITRSISSKVALLNRKKNPRRKSTDERAKLQWRVVALSVANIAYVPGVPFDPPDGYKRVDADGRLGGHLTHLSCMCFCSTVKSCAAEEEGRAVLLSFIFFDYFTVIYYI